MKTVRYLAYRALTPADYFNIYKPPRTEPRGGGQLYIDFPTSAIIVADWRRFFRGVKGLTETSAARGPRWECRIHSIGVPRAPGRSRLVMYQRRPQSVCIANQNLFSRGSERIPAWHPRHGFPQPRRQARRGESPPDGLTVFLVRTSDDEIWAGWFQEVNARSICEGRASIKKLKTMLAPGKRSGEANMLRFVDGQLTLRPSARGPVFTTSGAEAEEKALLDEWFSEEDDTSGLRDRRRKEYFHRVWERNKSAVSRLKALYRNRCQITGRKFTFRTKGGSLYVEAHHLVPLGEGGADNPHNIIIVSAHIHRMLHHAHVDQFDLKDIRKDKRGWGVLSIRIDSKPYRIRWHPRHLRVVDRSRQPA